MTAAKSPKPLRLNQQAQLVPEAQYARWHELASATAGLSKLELAILGVIAGHYRRLQTDGFAGWPSIERMALDLHAVPRDVRAAVWRLIGFRLVGVRPGAGRRPSEYLLALPKRLVASMAVTAVDDVDKPL